MKLVTTTGDLAGFYTDKSVAAPLAGMKGTGFKHIDLSMYDVIYRGSPWIEAGDRWKKEIVDCMRLGSENGFDFCQAHSPDGEHFREGEGRDNLILAIRRSIEACSMLGISHTVVHLQAVAGGTQEDFISKNIEFFRMFEEDMDRYNVDLLIENSAYLWNPEYYLHTGKEMREFIERAQIPGLHICWDTGHGNVQGQNQYDDILDMNRELRALHVHDNYGNGDSHVMPLVGTTNFDNVIKGLIKIGYTGDFTMECSNTIRRAKTWPHYRRDVKETDLLSSPPLYIQQKQMVVAYEIGIWMLESYNIPVE